MTRFINEKARQLSIELEKLAGKEKAGIWLDLAHRVSRPVRKKAEVNLYSLSVAAAKNAGKTIVVPGKVLATGVAGAKIEVACLSCSAAARQKIVKAGGKVLSIKQLAAAKPEAGKMVIIA